VLIPASWFHANAIGPLSPTRLHGTENNACNWLIQLKRSLTVGGAANLDAQKLAQGDQFGRA
jgi:hypothetical protein